jgi:putative oxidoreductase
MNANRFAVLYARIALGAAFLSAVAARFGLWMDRGPHPFAEFIRYTGEVNSFLPLSTYPFLAVAATIAEILLGIALVFGIALRWTAPAAAILLALFGTAMALSFGIKSPLDESVFSASAAAFLLARYANAECVAQPRSSPSSAPS